ncbi:acylphosphatase [Sphingomonas ginkgonis]|uniref:acylphosphatase n=1 Tax=Sphingomonas ginkgonis TaxID=2315330 RepID=A0A429VDA4_9SPHN|nr:acylphosphatase [Sphingomonas ginkgonis]RST31968.1 acylphosphatase [Sphingomonas ginkgonis]
MSGARRVRVRGTVQGVFYRQWTADRARALGVSGWVRNDPDGSVEALLEGESSALDVMISEMRRGPDGARVDRLDSEDAAAERTTGFEVRH